MNGDHHDRNRGDDRLEPLLLGLRELAVEDLQPDGDRRAEQHGGHDPGPHPAECVLAPLLAQEGGDDADDQRGLDPLAEADHERREHPSPFM